MIKYINFLHCSSIPSLIRVLETDVTAHVPPYQFGNIHIDMSTHIAIRLPEDNYMMLPISLDCPFLFAPSFFSNVYIVLCRWHFEINNVIEKRY